MRSEKVQRVTVFVARESTKSEGGSEGVLLRIRKLQAYRGGGYTFRWPDLAPCSQILGQLQALGIKVKPGCQYELKVRVRRMLKREWAR